MKLLSTTRQAVQAATAVAVVAGLSALFPQLERPYWATITALVVLCQTWSESMKKAAQRVAATFLGLAAAVLLHQALRFWPGVNVGVVFLCVFLFSYAVSRSYLWAIFWTSILVVMMFDLLGALDDRLVFTRMYETLLGACVAVLVSAFVLPVRVREQLRSDVPAFLGLVRASFFHSLSRAAGLPGGGGDGRHPELSGPLQRLREAFRTRQRESFLLRRQPSRARRYVLWLELLVFYDTDLRQAVEHGWDHRPAARVREELLGVRDRIARAMDQLVEALEGGGAVEVPPIDDLVDAMREKALPLLVAGVEERRACVAFFPILYYARKTHDALAAMAAEWNARKP